MHKDHHASRRARRKDTLSAEDPGILLQWHWKYGKIVILNQRQRVQLSLLMLFSAFTGNRPGVLLATWSSDQSTPQETSGLESTVKDSSQESLREDLSDPALKDDGDADTLVGEECKFATLTTRPNTICYGDINLNQVRGLKECRLTLARELRAAYRTIKRAQLIDLDRFQEHQAACRELTRVRAIHRQERKTKFREDFFDSMPDIEISKQIDQLLGNTFDTHLSDDAATEKWEPPVPEYAFPERSRIADALFGPDAESMTGTEALTRRIQVVSGLAALCMPRELFRCGKPFN